MFFPAKKTSEFLKTQGYTLVLVCCLTQYQEIKLTGEGTTEGHHKISYFLFEGATLLTEVQRIFVTRKSSTESGSVYQEESGVAPADN